MFTELVTLTLPATCREASAAALTEASARFASVETRTTPTPPAGPVAEWASA